MGKGTGLGLSICYGIIKEHGGDISAQNRRRVGQSSRFDFPPRRAGMPEPALPARAKSAIEGRVLLVEDEEAVLEFERDVLAGAGAEVVTLMNGEELKATLLSKILRCRDHGWQNAKRWNAPEVYRWMAENRPAWKSICC